MFLNVYLYANILQYHSPSIPMKNIECFIEYYSTQNLLQLSLTSIKR